MGGTVTKRRGEGFAHLTFGGCRCAVLGEAMRNAFTDGGYLLLIAVWDCGIDGVETDLSLCLAHGTGAAAIPRGAVRGH